MVEREYLTLNPSPKPDLEAALAGEPWSFSGVVFGVNRVLDDEGRPVSERRAAASAKVGVPMEFRPCPYPDRRKGRPMNVSALAQITRHFDAVLDEVGRFRALMPPGAPTWDGMLTTVVDQLSAPARYLLEKHCAKGPVPAQYAVGHKLAAGYFGVLAKLLRREAAGDSLPVSAESFGAFVQEQNALIGASEVCAGPPHLIQKASRTLIHGSERAPADLPRARLKLARLLAQQVRVGIGWELYDRNAERRFLLEEVGRAHLKARNPFLGRELERRVSAFEDGELDAGCRRPRLPEMLLPDHMTRLRKVLKRPSECGTSHARTVEVIEELHRHGEGALEILRTDASSVLATSFADYLTTLREFNEIQWHTEREIRALLGYPLETPVKPHPIILPVPKALRWFEVALGHNLRSGLAPERDLTLGNHMRTATIA